MKRKRHTTDEVIRKLCVTEVLEGRGQMIAQVLQKPEVSRRTPRRRRKRFHGVGRSALRIRPNPVALPGIRIPAGNPRFPLHPRGRARYSSVLRARPGASLRRPTMQGMPTARGRGGRRSRPRRRFPAEVLSPGEVTRLIGAVAGPPATAARNRAIIALAYRSGLRISEVLGLCPKDVDAAPGAGGSIRVLNGKGGRARTVGVDAGAAAILAAWSTYRAAYPVGDGDPLFCTRSGRAVTTAYVRRLFPHLAALAGIAKRVHAHGLRHTHAAELRAEGVDIGIISKQLGHTSIATTIRYLDHIAPRAVVEAVASRRWDRP